MRRVTVTNLLFGANLPKAEGAIPSRKCSFKEAAKCKISAYLANFWAPNFQIKIILSKTVINYLNDLKKNLNYKNDFFFFIFRQVLIFNEKNVVDCFQSNDIVSAMKFGRFGREDSALVLIGNGGGLVVKILKRTAQFETLESALAPQLSKVGTYPLGQGTSMYLLKNLI